MHEKVIIHQAREGEECIGLVAFARRLPEVGGIFKPSKMAHVRRICSPVIFSEDPPQGESSSIAIPIFKLPRNIES